MHQTEAKEKAFKLLIAPPLDIYTCVEKYASLIPYGRSVCFLPSISTAESRTPRQVTEKAKRSQLHFKLGGTEMDGRCATENLSILAGNASAVQVLAVNSAP